MNKIKVYPRGKKLWLYARINNQTYRYSSGYEVYNIKYVEKNKESIFNRVHNKSENLLSLKEYGMYVIDITSNQRNQFTQIEILSKFHKICEFFENIDITDIKSSMIMQWQNSLGLSPKSILNYRSVLNMIFEMAVNDMIIDRNPLKAVKPPKKEIKVTEYYTLNQINTLVNNATGQFKNILEFAFFSGMRPSEIIALKWQNVDFNDLSIFVNVRVRFNQEDMPKGYKERIIDMLPRAEKALKRQLSISAGCEYVFITHLKTRYKRSDPLDKHFKKLCNNSKLRVGRFYDTKHSFVTLMLQNNESETWLTQQLGHDNISVTRKHYTGKLKFNQEDFSKKYG